ncbi:thioredoxin TrxA [Candidatus Erwinia haradaeae]|uniref:thioredoxin TrxA n=1 Tax=Candidatus Erwinia haradaeae TaxID=1922217 RepID=UPI0013005A63|nr:thioredoxin TrxA [Candidatus Erwinia haradaeae]
MNNKIINLTDSSFEKDVIKSTGFILVDFWAEWCSPCKMLSPILDLISIEYEDKLIIGKINIDKNPCTAPQYSIRSIPTLLLFKEGQVIATQVGSLSKRQLSDFLDVHLN